MEDSYEFQQPMAPIRINEITGLWAFLKQIDWKEPWFTGLGIFHVTCAILTILTRKMGALQSVYFGVLLLMVFCAEQINKWAAENWSKFARQQYFDSNGLFISVVFSVPLLINCLIIVVSWLFDVGMLISNVKRLKIDRQTRKATAMEGQDQGRQSDIEEVEESSEEKKDK